MPRVRALPNHHERKAPKDEPSRSSDVNESKAESLEVAICLDILLYQYVFSPVRSLHMNMKQRSKGHKVL